MEKKSTSYSKIAEEVKDMLTKDQAMRERSLANEGAIETEEDDRLDFENTKRMKDIIKQIGWPTVSKVGAEVCVMTSLLVRHADHDVSFQKECLALMKAQSEGEVSREEIAFLEDRVRVNEGKPQLYGTQFMGEGENFIPRPIEDPDNVDRRRASMGMESMALYTMALKKKYSEK